MNGQIDKKRRNIVVLIIVLLLIGATILTVVLLNNRQIEGEELAYRDTGNVEKEDLTISKAELQTLINEVKTLDSAEYTDDTWLALLDELISAESVYSDGEATKNKIDAAIKSIREKINTLVTRRESTTEELESSESQRRTEDDSAQRPILTVDTLAPIVTVEYSNNGKPTNNDVVVTMATNEDTKSITGWTQVSKTKHTKIYKTNRIENVVVEDVAGNKSEIKIEVKGIDKEAPLIKGIKEGEIVNTIVSLTVTDKNLKGSRLNNIDYTNGTEIAAEGEYKLVAKDTAGNETVVNFEIDNTAPKVVGVIAGAIVNTPVTLTITDKNLKVAKLNDVDYTNGTEITTEGEYKLVVKDTAGNETVVNFEIDKTAPTITGIKNGTHHKTNVTPIITDKNINTIKLYNYITKDTIDFVSGTEMTEDGHFRITARDVAGNERIVYFRIDKTAPEVTGIIDGAIVNKAVTLTITDTNLKSSKLNDVDYTSGTEVTAEGQYKLVVKDVAGNETIVSFEIDKTAPKVVGITDGTMINRPVALTITDKNLKSSKLNEVDYISGAYIIEEGEYKLVVKDTAGNETIVNFEIDKTAPKVVGVTDGTIVNTSVTFTITDKNLNNSTLNGANYISGTEIKIEGNYQLLVRDKAGNHTIVNFEIDKTAPKVIGITDGKIVNTPVILTITDKNLKSSKLNDVDYTSGTEITAEGEYKLVVKDTGGNETVLNFEIDKTAPKVVGVTDNSMVNRSVTLTITDKNLKSSKLNDVDYISGTEIIAEGKYQLVSKDITGNETIVNFEIDKTAPKVIGITDGMIVNTPVTLTITDKNLKSSKLNDVDYTNGTEITTEGEYKLVVKDVAGNETIVNFEIDKTAPTITGIKNGTHHKTNVTPIITDKNIDTVKLYNYITNKTIDFVSGTEMTEDGHFRITAKDITGNEKIVYFKIDKTAPEVTGIIDGAIVNKAVTLTITDTNLKSSKLNDVDYTSGTEVTAEGQYKLVVKDVAGNETVVNFEIDKTAPKVIGIEEGSIVNTPVTLTVTDKNLKSSKLNDVDYTNGIEITTEGEYKLVVKDVAGNETVVNFEIDKTAPTITGIRNGTHHKTNLKPIITDKNINTIKLFNYITKDTTDFVSGTEMTEDGHYRITAKDITGNEKIVYFKIDKTAPEVTGIIDGAIVNKAVTLTITDTNLKSSKLNDIDYISGTEVTTEGRYKFIAKDTAGNETIVNFVIDKTAPQGRLKGLSSISLKVAEKYNEPGIEITDNIMAESEIANRVIKSYTFKAIGSTTYADVNSVDTSKAGQYYVYYNAKDLAGNEMARISRGVIIVDDVAPIGSLIGLKSINIKQGTTYQDQGITVTDNEDVNVSEKIVINYTFKAKGTDSYIAVDKIDTSKLGTYYIYYNAKDRSGNEMTEISRIVEIKESLKIAKSGVGSNIIVGDAGTTVNNFNSFAVTFNKDIVAKTNNDFRIGYKYRINGEGAWEVHPFINNWNGSLRTVDEGFWLYNQKTGGFAAGTIPANSIIRNSGTQAKINGQMKDIYTLIKDTKNSGNTIHVRTILYVKDDDFGTVETFELEEVKYWYDTAKNTYQATPRGLPEIK